MSGNAERPRLKLFKWFVRDNEEPCRCHMIAVATNINDAEEQVLKKIEEEVSCAWCIPDKVFFDGADEEIDDTATWKQFVKRTPPRVYELERGAVFFS